VHPVGSHYTDMSRCTVNKTLNILYQLTGTSVSKNYCIGFLDTDSRPSSTNLDVNFSVHRRPSLDAILHQFSPAVTTTSAFSRVTAPSRVSERFRTFGCLSCLHRQRTGSSEMLEAIYHITRCHKPVRLQSTLSPPPEP